MKRFLTISVITLVIFLTCTSPVFSQTREICAGSSAMPKSACILPDNRAEILKTFLEKYNSPLVPYALEFIKAADFYGIDWRLVPAITGVESSFGKQIPYGSYNAYGWNNGNWRFKSWKDSIWYVSSQLKTRYLDRGYKTVDQIGRIYAPPSPFWSGRVKSFMKKIEATSAFSLDL